MNTLSIFIDESGDFGDSFKFPAYYIVTMVFHEQSLDIKKEVIDLEKRLNENGFDLDYIHAAPIIRKEGLFENYSIDERRKLMYAMLDFTYKCNIKYKNIVIDRRHAKTTMDLSGEIGRSFSRFLSESRTYLDTFDSIIVYYDNGQHELGRILNALFSMNISNVEFRLAYPKRYRLLQVADFVCTLELLRMKQDTKCLSKSEQQFFYKPQELKKNFFKLLKKKEL